MSVLVGGSQEQKRHARRKLIVSVVAVSVIVHLLAGAVAGLYIVARYFSQPEAVFEVQRELIIPAENRPHKMNMAEFDALMPKPVLQEKLQSIRPSEFALPDLPKVPMDQLLPLDTGALISDQLTSLIGADASGIGAGLGQGGGGGNGEGFSFFGIDSNASRVVLLFDVSSSVVTKAKKNRIPFSEIKSKTLELIDGFSVNTRFNLVQFTRNYMVFEEELIAASDANKRHAKSWVVKKWTTKGSLSSSRKGVVRNPDGLLAMLEKVYQMQPDVIFVISDGSFSRAKGGDIQPGEIGRVIQRIEREQGSKVPLNFIGFGVERKIRTGLRRIVRRTGGTFRELGSKGS